MAISFPASPADGQVYIPGSGAPSYYYSASTGAWKVLGSASAIATLVEAQIAGGASIDEGFLDACADDLDDGKGPGLLKQGGGEPLDGSELSLVVQVSPNTPLTLDQSVPAVVGGIAPSGAALRARVGEDGGFQAADTPPAKTYTVSGGQLNVFTIDTTGYLSVAVQMSPVGAGTAILSFFTSNDGSTWAAIIGSTSSGFASAGITASSNYVMTFPVSGRYFRCTAGSVTPTVLVTPMLRSTPAPIVLGANITAVGGTQLVGPGLGIGQFGLPIFVADPSTAGRALRGDTNGNLTPGGVLLPGYQIGSYNVSYSTYTTARSGVFQAVTAGNSTLAPLLVGGVDQTNAARFFQTDSFGNQQVTSAPATPASQSIQDLLTQIVGLLRVNNHYLYELRSQTNPLSAADEPDALLADYTNPATFFTNTIN